jgi:hypothetical protein
MDDIFKLIILVVKMNEEFSKTVYKEGFTWAFNGARPAINDLSLSTPSLTRSPDRDTVYFSV